MIGPVTSQHGDHYYSDLSSNHISVFGHMLTLFPALRLKYIIHVFKQGVFGSPGQRLLSIIHIILGSQAHALVAYHPMVSFL